MKINPTSLRVPLTVVMLVLALAANGCKNGSNATADRKPIPLAPVGVSSSGIGGPGGASMDTRAVGSVATGEGDQPSETQSGVTPIVATPGNARPAPGPY